MIREYCEPRKTVSKEEFLKKYPGFSVALDGHVYGETFQLNTKKGPYANFNHHEGVNRIETRSTCAQVLLAIELEAFESYNKGKKQKDDWNTMNIWYNDPDQDTSLAIWLLKNYPKFKGTKNIYRINRLVNIEDKLDITLGTGPREVDIILKQMAWMFEPYTKSRIEGKLDVKNHDQLKYNMKSIVEEISERITKHVKGSDEYMELDQRYEKLKIGKRFMMIKETGPHARINIFKKNPIDAFVVVRQREDQKYIYSIIMHPYKNYPRNELCKQLNDIEKHEGQEYCWGGGSNNISSSRIKGSDINPDELYKIMNKMRY